MARRWKNHKIIFDEGMYDSDYLESLKADGTLPEDADISILDEMQYNDFGDEEMNLKVSTENEIVAIAVINRWDGTSIGFKPLHSTIISDILTLLDEGEKKFYSDGVDICCDQAHHDGINHIIFREMRDGRDASLFGERVRSGKPVTPKVISYYTRSLCPHVHKVYGW